MSNRFYRAIKPRNGKWLTRRDIERAEFYDALYGNIDDFHYYRRQHSAERADFYRRLRGE